MTETPQPGQTWKSQENGWKAIIRQDGRFVIVEPQSFGGTTLGQRQYWTDEELADWVRVSGPLACTLHLEVRSKSSRPGQPNTQQRTYTRTVETDFGEQDCTDLHMTYSYSGIGYGSHSTVVLKPAEYDEPQRAAVYRESRAASDKFVERIESFGWTRRPDLEARP